MLANQREAAALAKLIKLARTRSDEASRRVEDLNAAMKRTEDEIRLLVESVHTEESAARAAEIVGFVQLAGFLAGATQKRAALEETKAQLAAEIETAIGELETAHIETKKLEHLIDRARQSVARRRRHAEGAVNDEAALARFVRKSAR